MSIIEEALKKAQYNYANRRTLPSAAEEPSRPSVPPVPANVVDSRIVFKNMAIIIYVIVLLALVAGFIMRTLFLKISEIDRDKRLAVMAQKAELNTDSKQYVRQEPVKNTSHVPNLVLNGIMYFPERPKAIINGTTVRNGDVVGGAIVTSIREDSVLVKYNNGDNNVEMVLKIKE